MQSQIEKLISGKGGEIYQSVLGALSEYAAPHEFIASAYEVYLRDYPDNPSTNGRIFEYLICETLARKRIFPFYYQARFKHVPNADFDVVLYNEIAPIVLTMKVSLRERYKQADLEGLALRNVYRQAQSHLITLSENEVPGVTKKIKSGHVSGLNTCILASTPEYTDFLNELAQQKYKEAEPIMPIEGSAFQPDML